MTVTDPVERAARIIAAHVEPVWSWDQLTDKWRADYRLAAEAVLNDLTHAGQPAPQVDASYESLRIDPTTDRDRWDVFDGGGLEAPGEDEP